MTATTHHPTPSTIASPSSTVLARPQRVVAGLGQRLDLVAVMITVIIAGVTGYVGIQIMDTTVDTGTGNVDVNTGLTDPANATGFENASADLTTGLESFFSQIGTVFVVIVLVVIIGYLMLLRGR